jgi:hypothetical protein
MKESAELLITAFALTGNFIHNDKSRMVLSKRSLIHSPRRGLRQLPDKNLIILEAPLIRFVLTV